MQHIDMGSLTLEQFALLEGNLATANRLIDDAVKDMKAHKDAGACPHYTCASAEFLAWAVEIDQGWMPGLLQIAVTRLAEMEPADVEP